MPPQKPKTSAVVIICIILGVLLVCCGLPIGIGGFYGMKGFKGAMAIGGCMTNAEAMQKALHQYSAEHDGKLPSASTWQSDLGKYLVFDKDSEDSPLKMWKKDGEWSCEESGNKTGFMFNEALSEKKVADVTKTDPNAIAIFETKTVARNQSGPLVILPLNESPKFFGEFTDQRRGWILIDAKGSTMLTKDAAGNIKKFDMNFESNGRHKNGVNITIDSNSDSKGSKDSGDSKDDNSN